MQKAHPRRVVRVAAVVARVEVNATQRNSTTSRNLDLAGLNTGRSSSAEDGEGKGKGVCCSNGGLEPVFLLIYLFLSPLPPSSPAKRTAHAIVFFFSSPEKKEKRNRGGRFYHLSADVGRVLRQSH